MKLLTMAVADKSLVFRVLYFPSSSSIILGLNIADPSAQPHLSSGHGRFLVTSRTISLIIRMDKEFEKEQKGTGTAIQFIVHYCSTFDPEDFPYLLNWSLIGLALDLCNCHTMAAADFVGRLMSRTTVSWESRARLGLASFLSTMPSDIIAEVDDDNPTPAPDSLAETPSRSTSMYADAGWDATSLSASRHQISLCNTRDIKVKI
ncbi:hypothetical protein BDW74DRAFT_6622 [Aspergillus multicolor]|uniref:uncharacterized protein n=1 Tax=Aspergillus multicolor TaxID=41759 RepID=UPI003CCCF4B2